MKRIKGVIASILMAALAISLSTQPMKVEANSNKKIIKGMVIKVNGKKISIKDEPYKLNGTIYVSVVPIFKALKASTELAKGTLTVKKGDCTLKLKNGSNKAILNDTEKTISGSVRVAKGKVYAPLTSIRLAESTVDWFSSTKTAVIYSYVKKNVCTYYDYFDENNTTYETIMTQVSVFKRLYASGLFKYPSDTKEILLPKDSKTLLQVYLPDEEALNKDAIDVNIYVKKQGFGLYTRHKVKEILKVCYPTKYKEIYKLFVKALREEIWDHKFDNDCPGVGGKYFDDRRLDMLNQRFSSEFSGCYITVSPYKVKTSALDIETDNNRHPAWLKQQPDIDEIIKEYELDIE